MSNDWFREEVLELVEELVNLHVPNLRICVTSRPEADILCRLAFRSVSLRGENGQNQDIAEYKSGPTLKCEHGGLPIKEWIQRTVQSTPCDYQGR
jgi:hypothetical protein